MAISETVFAYKCNNYQTGCGYIFLLSKHTKDWTETIYRKDSLPVLLLTKYQESCKVIALKIIIIK